MKVIKFAPGLIPVFKHQEHDQSSHGNWATGTDVWSATKGNLETTFTTKDGSLKVKVLNAFMDNPEYKETIKKTLDTAESLQNDFPIKGEIYFQEGEFVTGTNKAWATTMTVSEGGKTSSQMTLTEGLLKPTARKDFLEYTITHEWGHAIDRRSSERALQAMQTIARSENAPMTKYGFRNGREAFAEAFAVKRLRSHEGGILSEDVPQDPKWERTFNILEVPDVVSKATNENGFSFFVADTFDLDNPPVLIEGYTPPVQKHQEHDQSSHGNWATGGEIQTWNPKDPIPESPRNAGGMTAKSWEAWEHGPDGQNFIALFRKYAAQELGLEVPKTPFDPGEYLNYMMDRGWGKPSREEAKGMLNAIANGRPQPALYRGMTDSTDPEEQKSFDALLSTKPGDTFDMPLVSTTRSVGVATWYAADVMGVGEKSVVMKIQDGAKGVSLKKENSVYPQDHEVITSGKFEVVSVSKVSIPYWSRGIFEPRKNDYKEEYGGTTYEVATYAKKTYSPAEAKIAYEAVQSGNLSSLETPDFKLTDDRASKGSLSSWTREPTKEFTVIEVKMVEPHTVQKAKDYGNEFFFLFNNMPYIHDGLEDVRKHQEHDQSSHGNWATGQKGGSGLSHREMFNLKRNRQDPLVKKVYEAEEKNHNQVQNKNIEQPEAPARSQFEEYSDYNDAYKKYSKDFLNWSKEVTTAVISPMGKKHLDGTPTGVNGYVRDVLRQDWFIEQFGKGGSAGNPEVKVSSTSEAGSYQIGFKGDKPISILSVNRGYSKAEPNLVHEIAHYATTISATSPHDGHGVEFVRNHLYIAGKVMGDSFANQLENSYREAGIPLGD